jgi:hypothetical protein
MEKHLKKIRHNDYIIKVYKNDTGTNHKYRAWGFINGSTIKEVALNAPSYHLLGDDIDKLVVDLKLKINGK